NLPAPSLTHPAPPPTLPSFPTRRSSDLLGLRRFRDEAVRPPVVRDVAAADRRRYQSLGRGREAAVDDLGPPSGLGAVPNSAPSRSEEHTSELQSRSDLVCRLLLEKKN